MLQISKSSSQWYFVLQSLHKNVPVFLGRKNLPSCHKVHFLNSKPRLVRKGGDKRLKIATTLSVFDVPEKNQFLLNLRCSCLAECGPILAHVGPILALSCTLWMPIFPSLPPSKQNGKTTVFENPQDKICGRKKARNIVKHAAESSTIGWKHRNFFFVFLHQSFSIKPY